MHPKERAHLRALCDELREDDGVDPRRYFKSEKSRQRDHRKSRQLCRQIGRALELVLAGETGDDALRDLRIVSIAPGEDSSSVIVTVRMEADEQLASPEEIRSRLAMRQGALRSVVAATITRRQTPKLTFRVLVGSDEALPENGEAGT